jgi:cbb3-type cytochrome oxidase subunit 3
MSEKKRFWLLLTLLILSLALLYFAYTNLGRLTL